MQSEDKAGASSFCAPTHQRADAATRDDCAPAVRYAIGRAGRFCPPDASSESAANLPDAGVARAVGCAHGGWRPLSPQRRLEHSSLALLPTHPPPVTRTPSPSFCSLSIFAPPCPAPPTLFPLPLFRSRHLVSAHRPPRNPSAPLQFPFLYHRIFPLFPSSTLNDTSSRFPSPVFLPLPIGGGP